MIYPLKVLQLQKQKELKYNIMYQYKEENVLYLSKLFMNDETLYSQQLPLNHMTEHNNKI